MYKLTILDEEKIFKQYAESLAKNKNQILRGPIIIIMSSKNSSI